MAQQMHLVAFLLGDCLYCKHTLRQSRRQGPLSVGVAWHLLWYRSVLLSGHRPAGVHNNQSDLRISCQPVAHCQSTYKAEQVLDDVNSAILQRLQSCMHTDPYTCQHKPADHAIPSWAACHIPQWYVCSAALFAEDLFRDVLLLPH